MQHDAHLTPYMDHILAELLACLLPIGAPEGWAAWSRYAANGEW